MGQLLIFWLGACLGSFLNVAAFRWPRGESIVWPRSHCPQCGKTIAWHDNIPILSWFWLLGRCRGCRKAISWRYPAVELAMAVLALGLWLRWRPLVLWAGAACLAAAGFLAVSLIDWDTFLIPDELSLGLWAAGLAFSPANPLLLRQAASWPHALALSASGGIFGFVLCWSIAAIGEWVFKKESMGGGDIKLLAAVGSWTGVLGVFDCLMLASLVGAVYGILQMLQGKMRRADPIPFGPFLSLGAVFNLFCLLRWGFPFS